MIVDFRVVMGFSDQIQVHLQKRVTVVTVVICFLSIFSIRTVLSRLLSSTFYQSFVSFEQCGGAVVVR